MSPIRPARGFLLLCFLLALTGSSPLDAQSRGKKEKEKTEKTVERTAAQEAALTALIEKELGTLFSGRARYDGKAIHATYLTGQEIRDDHEWVGKSDPKNVDFEVWHSEFEGHTEGFLLLKPHFRGDIRVDLQLTYKGLEKGATFFTLVHATESTFVGSNLGAHAIVKSGRKVKTVRARSKEYRRDPSRWIDRTAISTHNVIIADGELQVGYNGFGASTKLDDEAPKKGQVGFYWKGVFFRIQSIEIRGELDRDWAAEQLGFDPSSVEEPAEEAETDGDEPGEDSDDADET